MQGVSIFFKFLTEKNLKVSGSIFSKCTSHHSTTLLSILQCFPIVLRMKSENLPMAIQGLRGPLLGSSGLSDINPQHTFVLLPVVFWFFSAWGPSFLLSLLSRIPSLPPLYLIPTRFHISAFPDSQNIGRLLCQNIRWIQH